MRYFASVLMALCCLVTAGCGGGGSGSSTIPSAARLVGNPARTAAVSSRRSILSVESATPYTALVIGDNPIAYYRLNDTNSVMMDSGPHTINGVYGSNVSHSGIALTSGTGAQSSIFPGSAAGANVELNTGTVTTNALFASATTGLTVEAWIQPAALNATNHFLPVVSYGREIQGQAWVMQISPQSSLNFWIKTTGGKSPSFSVKSTTLLSPAQTFHVVSTYDGTSAKLYVNGKLDTTVAANGAIDYSALLPTWGLGIGGALGGTEPIFKGAVSNVAIYPTALSASDIEAHYATGSIVTPTPAATTAPYTALIEAGNPLAYYKLKDTGSTLTDSGANKVNGVYGTSVKHGAAPLTSASDTSSIFPGSVAGSSVPSNAATVEAGTVLGKPTTNLSVETWIKPADYNRTNNYIPIVAYGREIIGSVWAIEITPQSSLTFYLKAGSKSYEVKPVGTLLPAQVYHIIATYNGSTAGLYINGTLAASTPASGALNYAGLSSQYGLAIGGALGGTLPIFNGSINDVAIYSSALSAQAIQQHYLSGEIATPITESATSSDAFVDSIGVVTHLRTTGGPYTASFPAFQSLIKASGIRHIGDTLTPTPSWYPQEIKELEADGIHASLITNLGESAQYIENAIPVFQNAIEAIEGPNEPDLSGDSNWVADTRAFQKLLWSTVKANPATAYLSVVGPSMVSQADDSALGNISSAMDAGSIHDYFNGYNPGTAGWGSLSQYGIYGSIAWDLNVCGIVSGSKPVLSTETGYSDLPSNTGSVDSRTLARYVPRIYLEQFLAGIPRTTLYEFYDEPDSGNFANFGLVESNNKPKSSYYAVKSLISTLSDPGIPYSPKPLTYVLSGNLDNVHHLLLQKRDGTYQLVIWVEVEGYDPIAKTDISVPTHTVLLKPASTPASASAVTIGDSGSLTTKSLTFAGGTASFSIDDHVTIVSFK